MAVQEGLLRNFKWQRGKFTIFLKGVFIVYPIVKVFFQICQLKQKGM
jgi:hypothetical protein